MAWYERLDMWVTLAIVGYVSYLMLRDRLRGLAAFAGARLAFTTNDRHPTPNAIQPPVPRIKPAEVEHMAPRLLPRARWWLDFVDHDAHIMIVGETRSGKSTTARALLVERARTDAIQVIDPHGKFNDWGVIPIGYGRNFDVIAAAMRAFHEEFERRFKADEPVGEPLTMFVDEYPAIVAARPEVAVFVKQWLREAAKARIRLVFLAQDANVKTLGIEGEGAVRSNLRMLLLGRFASVAGPVDPRVERWAALDRPGGPVAVDLYGLPKIAERAIDPSVLWQFPEPETTPQPFQPPETPVSPVAIAQSEDDDEFRNVDFTPLARLVQAGAIGETKLLEVAFEVKPGSSHRYLAARARLKAAMEVVRG